MSGSCAVLMPTGALHLAEGARCNADPGNPSSPLHPATTTMNHAVPDVDFAQLRVLSQPCCLGLTSGWIWIQAACRPQRTTVPQPTGSKRPACGVWLSAPALNCKSAAIALLAQCESTAHPFSPFALEHLMWRASCQQNWIWESLGRSRQVRRVSRTRKLECDRQERLATMASLAIWQLHLPHLWPLLSEEPY